MFIEVIDFPPFDYFYTYTEKVSWMDGLQYKNIKRRENFVFSSEQEI